MQLPFPTDTGEPLTAIGESSKKRDAERRACLQACQLLDRYELFKVVQTKKQSRMEFVTNEVDDDDEYFDRTGGQKAASKKSRQVTQTFESLSERKQELLEQIESAQRQHGGTGAAGQTTGGDDDEDEFEAYMQSLQSTLATETQSALKKQLDELQQVRKLDDLGLN
jgi:hypothetical protein